MVAGVRPSAAARAWLAGLPRLPGLRAATFCTFAIAPKGTLAAVRGQLEGRGMAVLAEQAFGRGNIDGDVAAFTARLRDLAWPADRQIQVATAE